MRDEKENQQKKTKGGLSVDIDTIKYTNIEEKFHVVDIDLDEGTYKRLVVR